MHFKIFSCETLQHLASLVTKNAAYHVYDERIFQPHILMPSTTYKRVLSSFQPILIGSKDYFVW